MRSPPTSPPTSAVIPGITEHPGWRLFEELLLAVHPLPTWAHVPAGAREGVSSPPISEGRIGGRGSKGGGPNRTEEEFSSHSRHIAYIMFIDGATLPNPATKLRTFLVDGLWLFSHHMVASILLPLPPTIGLTHGHQLKGKIMKGNKTNEKHDFAKTIKN